MSCHQYELQPRTIITDISVNGVPIPDCAFEDLETNIITEIDRQLPIGEKV